MRQLQFLLTAAIALLLSSCQSEFKLENEFLSRTIRVDKGVVHTSLVENKLADKQLVPQDNAEFRLRISQGTDKENTDVVITSEDFKFKKVESSSAEKLALLLENKEHQINLTVVYELETGKPYLNKYLEISADNSLTLERIDVECISSEDIYQPYQEKKITASAPWQWKPGLGQPLYTSESATFWGVEFPASYNYVENNTAYCGYQWGREIKSEETYTSYRAVMGVGDDGEFIQDAFFDYIDHIRIRPLRLQVQYNSWFDFGRHVTKDDFVKSVAKVNEELVVKRGVTPLRDYVIDDGWQNAQANWCDTVWKVNTARFEPDLASSLKAVKDANSSLGLWLSPGCNFGARPAVPTMRENGLEALDQYMSLAGPQYMQLLEDRMVELTKMGVDYFKLDGLFGHLNRREFELHGESYGLPSMPQLGLEGLNPADKRLNDPKYDELKTYYLVAGTERLMQIFEKQHEVNPEVYIVISNGAYLSPWWLMSVDAIWMINAGDAAHGSDRTQEMVYRDEVYHGTWLEEKTQFPINSVFNHEPKKVKTGESAEAFRKYLWMNLSRGTGFVELYIKTDVLSQSDWDVLADGLKWVEKMFPYFKGARMHGGSPKLKEIYGYTGWAEEGGYVSLHNPSEETKTYSFTLDRAMGLVALDASYTVFSSLENAVDFNANKKLDFEGHKYKAGDKIEITLGAGEVKILEFSKTN
ncbi:MAG: hypothetical protein ACK5LR_10140 [Mangrovibacterium sp.]